jgi:hypothetical protein
LVRRLVYSFTAVLLDAKRNQVYLSVGDHVDVFSTASNQFVTPLHPASQGAQKKFTGLALTPDGSQLLVADLLDGTLAVINPDTPSSTYVISIAAVNQGINGNCPTGSLYVAATSANQAFVATGSLPAPACPASGIICIANRQSRAVTIAQRSGGTSVDSSADGNLVGIGGLPCEDYIFGPGGRTGNGNCQSIFPNRRGNLGKWCCTPIAATGLLGVLRKSLADTCQLFLVLKLYNALKWRYLQAVN